MDGIMAKAYYGMRFGVARAAREITYCVGLPSNRYPMRRHCLTSALLVLALAASASACAMDWCSGPRSFCAGLGVRRDCAWNKIGTAANGGKACLPAAKSTPTACSLRSFVQFQFVAFDRCETWTSLPSVAGKILARPDSRIVVSSIGSPETDRGPPRS